MRPRPVDHSLWLAIGHAAKLPPPGANGGAQSRRAAEVIGMMHRALDQGANPDSEFILPDRKEGFLTLSCMERGFGQLHGEFLVPLLDYAIEKGWSANSVPCGLWSAGAFPSQTTRRFVQPVEWTLSAELLGKEPGWLQLVACGTPWGSSETSASLCRLLVNAGAPFLRPAQAVRHSEGEEGSQAHRELEDPMRLAAGSSGNLDVALALVELGVLENWRSPEAFKYLMQEVELGWKNNALAPRLLSVLKSHRDALELGDSTQSISNRATGSRRTL